MNRTPVGEGGPWTFRRSPGTLHAAPYENRTETPTMPLSPTLKAAVWMIGALFSFMAVAVSGRELGQATSVFQIQFYRSLVGLIVVAAWPGAPDGTASGRAVSAST